MKPPPTSSYIDIDQEFMVMVFTLFRNIIRNILNYQILESCHYNLTLVCSIDAIAVCPFIATKLLCAFVVFTLYRCVHLMPL
jgi:hypothetical protein